jgi:hypothetical protein
MFDYLFTKENSHSVSKPMSMVCKLLEGYKGRIDESGVDVIPLSCTKQELQRSWDRVFLQDTCPGFLLGDDLLVGSLFSLVFWRHLSFLSASCCWVLGYSLFFLTIH